MGLFSFLSKNKQQTTAQDSGYYSRADEQASTARARSRRASSADGAAAPRRVAKDAADPVLPEKKRARRRLVGAIALALAVAVGLPMMLDTEPKPLASDIAIQIPSKDKAPPAAQAKPAGAASSKVAASEALDLSEEIVAAPAKPTPAESPAIVMPPPMAELKTEPVVKAPKADASKPDAKPLAKTEPKHESRPLVVKPVEEKPVAEAADPAPVEDDAARARAILEGKPAFKVQEAAPQKFVVQVAALATQDKVDELQSKLKVAGIKSYTQKVPTPAGERTRIRVGPFASKEEAEKMRAKLTKLGLGGSLVPA